MTLAPESQLFYLTAPAPCPYLPDRYERKVMTELGSPDANTLHDRLAIAGFRRNHHHVYAPNCSGCAACIPFRIPVKTFKANRTMRGIQRRHKGLHVSERPSIATSENYALFRKYLTRRHQHGDMALMDFDAYRAMVENSPVDTSLYEFRTQETRLVCVSLVDHLSDGLSAVYTFYAPDDAGTSYGTKSILWLIGEAQRRHKSFLYLGYWVPGSPKMAYKAKFRPAEILRDGAWRTLTNPAT